MTPSDLRPGNLPEIGVLEIEPNIDDVNFPQLCVVCLKSLKPRKIQALLLMTLIRLLETLSDATEQSVCENIPSLIEPESEHRILVETSTTCIITNKYQK